MTHKRGQKKKTKKKEKKKGESEIQTTNKVHMILILKKESTYDHESLELIKKGNSYD